MADVERHSAARGEHSGAAPQPTRRKAFRRSLVGRGADRFLQSARTSAEIKKSEKPAEHRYKLSSAEIAVVTGRRHSKAAAPMSERGTFRNGAISDLSPLIAPKRTWIIRRRPPRAVGLLPAVGFNSLPGIPT